MHDNSDEIVLPAQRTQGDTLRERMSENAYDRILPARYLKRDEHGETVEDQEEFFERVAKNLAVAEAVYHDETVYLDHDDIKPDHPRRDELIDEVFGDETTTVTLTEDNASWVAYDPLMASLHTPEAVKRTMRSAMVEFREQMETLSLMPNTPTLMHLGNELQMGSACFVMSPDDDMSDIHKKARHSALVQSAGGGVGYAFWKLRPYGDVVGSTGGIASGPISFMRTFDQLCDTIKQGGSRRGAQMGVMRVTHPDIPYFIGAKNADVSLAQVLRLNDPDDYRYTTFAEALDEARGLIDDEGRIPDHLRNAAEGHLSNFNISVGVTDEFMEAVQADEDFTLINPRTGEPHIATEETEELYGWFDLDQHVEVGEPLSVPATELFDRMVDGAYENGEPGMVFMDQIHRDHSFDARSTPDASGGKHEIIATNPCGEQPLEEYESCNLEHINLSTLAAADENGHTCTYDGEEDIGDFLDRAIRWDEFNDRIEVGVRMLDNVITMSNFPVDRITEAVENNRKIGLGIMGLAQLYIQLGVEYGSDDANEIARRLLRHMDHESKRQSYLLAQERGVFDNWDESKYASPDQYAEWFEHHTGESPSSWSTGYPIRNHNTLTIAPTGTTSMIADTSGGCEPLFSVANYKNVSDDVQGDEMLVEFDSYFRRVLDANGVDADAVKAEAEELMAMNEFDGPESLSEVPAAIGELFVTSGDLSAAEHAGVQLACQEYIDSAVSKCVEEGTLIQTDQGPVPIESFSANRTPGTFSDPNDDYTIDGNPVTSHYFDGESQATKVRFDNGSTIVGGTENHTVKTPDGWTRLVDLSPGDIVYGGFTEGHGDPQSEIGWETIDEGKITPITAPERMSEELSEFMGTIAADGQSNLSTGFVGISTSHDHVKDRFIELVEGLFDFVPYVQDNTSEGVETVYIISREIAKFVQSTVGDSVYSKTVPDVVLSGSAAEKMAFLRGLSVDGYNSPTGFVVYEGMSEDLARRSAALLRSFGTPRVDEGRTWVSEADAHAHSVRVSGPVAEIVDPIRPWKNVYTPDVRYKVPFDPYEHRDREDFDTSSEEYTAIHDMCHNGSMYAFDTTLDKYGVEHSGIAHEVVEVQQVGERRLFDIEVEDSNQYNVGGVTNHNTTNAAQDSTRQDAADVFMQIWEGGGKGVTYYRDGSRSKQVLTTRADNQGDDGDGAETDETESESEPTAEPVPSVPTTRERPDTLTGITERIPTGYGKVYVTINADENGNPFELFATRGQSGGFVNGLIEAIGKLASTALRSGADPQEIIDDIGGIRSPKIGWYQGRQVHSIPSAIGIALEHFIDDSKPVTEIEEAESDQPTTDGGSRQASENTDAAQRLVAAGESPECPDCSTMLSFSEGCEKCESCGWSKC